MKINELDHDLTPDTLRNLNVQICECVNAPPDEQVSSGFQRLNALIAERDELIHSILASPDHEFVREFAAREQVVNDKLKDMAHSLLIKAKDDVSHFIRSQAAVKKYK
ncbi:MAG: hypothetical protein HWE26_18450 [Alteromonadaceae bacterium]|nr:hypothetical protein [Alteromonadaceae bacterium]